MFYKVTVEMKIEGPDLGEEEMESMIERNMDLMPFDVKELMRVEVTEVRHSRMSR